MKFCVSKSHPRLARPVISEVLEGTWAPEEDTIGDPSGSSGVGAMCIRNIKQELEKFSSQDILLLHVHEKIREDCLLSDLGFSQEDLKDDLSKTEVIIGCTVKQ